MRSPKFFREVFVYHIRGLATEKGLEVLRKNMGRLDAIQAAVLRVKLRHLENWQQQRREKAAHYDRLFIESGLVNRGALQLPKASYSEKGFRNHHTFYQYVIRTRQRDGLQAFLSEKGIGTAVYYPLPLHLLFKYINILKFPPFVHE